MNDDTTFAIATAPKRNSRHWTPGTITWGELCGWLKKPGTKKEAGNYFLGTLEVTTVSHDPKEPDNRCTEIHRRKNAVVSRSAITLDIDSPDPGFLDNMDLIFPYTAIIHSTYSSAPDAPRYRMIIPTDREMAPDEYVYASEAIMGAFGPHQFDPGSSEPERYMFRPATQEPSWFSYVVLDGRTAPVDTLLTGWERKLHRLPMPKPNKTKRDPFSLPGVVGAFNSVYEDLDLLIEVYDLPYTKVDENRYQLAGSVAEAGMGPIADTRGLFYSHHANDPAYGQTCTAFDLVRMHRFGELDEGKSKQTPINRLPSYQAMMELAASTDHRVTAFLVGADFSEDMDDVVSTSSWRTGLLLSKRGEVRDEIKNWDLIVENDPVFNQLVYNELSMSPEWTGDAVPWRTITDQTRVVSPSDRWEMFYYVWREYFVRATKDFITGLLESKAVRTRVNPVRDYLNGLVWDGVSRVETCLPGVRDSPQTRLIARKSMVAAVARMLDPGCKWDHTLVLQGDEGLGKSWWVHRMARGFSAPLGPVSSKDTLLAMQRAWIITSDEGHSLKKGDADMLKDFLTRTHDVFRMPYEKETLVHPRHSVIWSTVNDETFLRRQEGNRRFLVVKCESRVDFDLITDRYVDQVWAEAVRMYQNGERLFMDTTESADLSALRETFVEEDTLSGILQEYLDQKVPKDWWDRSPESRLEWMDARDKGFESEGTEVIDRTCSRMLWREALGQRFEPRRVDLLEITNALKTIPGWVPAPGRHRIPGYGPQLTHIREDLL